MKKQFIITLFATALLSMASVAQAGNSHRGHYGGHYRGHSSHHYGRAYRHHGYRRHGRRHHNNHDGLKIVVGALVLGSLIHAVSNNQRRQVVYSSPTARLSKEYWYIVDSNGQCVEVRLNERGNEVWTYVDSSYCN